MPHGLYIHEIAKTVIEAAEILDPEGLPQAPIGQRPRPREG